MDMPTVNEAHGTSFDTRTRCCFLHGVVATRRVRVMTWTGAEYEYLYCDAHAAQVLAVPNGGTVHDKWEVPLLIYEPTYEVLDCSDRPDHEAEIRFAELFEEGE